MTNTTTFGAAHGTTRTLAGAELAAWASDRRDSWAFMRAEETAGRRAGYPHQVDGTWTVYTAA